MKNILLIVIAIVSTNCAAQQNPFRMLTEKNGKIGINTNTPDEMLTVKGKIHTQEVIVDLQGAVAPDYVFELYADGFSKLKPAYTLMSIPTLEAFVKEHKHLPNVPSATELEKEGMSLKAMNLLLLEKVEELTLYTIQQQKQIDLLQEKVNAIEIKK